jgi:hypothetical protein
MKKYIIHRIKYVLDNQVVAFESIRKETNDIEQYRREVAEADGNKHEILFDYTEVTP